MGIFSKIFGDYNERYLRKLYPVVNQINKLESKFQKFSNDDLKKQTAKFKEIIKKSSDKKDNLEKILNEILPEAFALVREAAKRTLNQRHFDVQILAGIVLHQGKIAEMKTGEGKTLAATLPVYLNALTGKGVHIVTVNDYLAKRDTNWMGPIYHLLGLSCACIVHDKAYLYQPKTVDKNEVTIEMENLIEVPRKKAYEADITYGTNNEFGFDYLRDNMAQSLDEIVQRELHYAIVDEVDSILIDEARTPLIISIPDTESPRLYQLFAKIVTGLKENEDYNIDEKMRVVTLTEKGIEKVEKILGIDIYQEGGIRYVHHLEEALRAQVLFHKDKDYIVKDNQVIIVDEFTGRLMFGRRFSGGLHQALEAKEGVPIQPESRTLATITFQNYFRMYEKLTGMTGTAYTSAEEFSKVYNLDVIIIPTNKPMIRKDLPDKIYKTERGKFKAVIEEVKRRHKNSQPVLVGTVSIEKNELLSKMLEKEGIPHSVLNAKNHEKEAQIIAKAGRKGAVTVATNMAGRGVDIILGGRPEEYSSEEEWEKAHDEVVSLGGLHIIGTERHEARRIDNQLRGRAGRQGDPGSSQFFVSLEDDLMRIFGGDKMRKIMDSLKIPEDQPIENKFISQAIESAQAKMEGYNFDIRKHILEYDEVLNKQRDYIYKKRRKILKEFENKDSKDRPLKKEILKMVENEIRKIVEFHTSDENPDNWRYEEICETMKAIFNPSSDIHSEILKFETPEKIYSYCVNLAKKAYEEKEKELKDEMGKVEKFILLRTIDTLWMEHLDNMEHLRDSVNLRAYGHKDPLVEYKKEGHRLFHKLLDMIESNVVGMIYKVSLGEKTAERESAKVLDRSNKDKPGRNDPCPCGSGKKYKHCCWPKYG